MPQVDLETLVSVCGASTDRKIACETVAAAIEASIKKPDVHRGESDVIASDLPPESFCLPKDAELDWFRQNAFYERKESTRGNSNSLNSSSNSQRFSLNLKSTSTILGLPKTRKSNYVDMKRRSCKSANIRLFPKRSQTVGKSAVQFAEPSSPKVSCLGKVRSIRGLRRTSEPEQKNKKNAEKERRWLSSYLISIFRCRCGKPMKPDLERNEEATETKSRKCSTAKTMDIPVIVEPMAAAPGLGAVTRFSSGRRSWSSEDIDVARS